MDRMAVRVCLDPSSLLAGRQTGYHVEGVGPALRQQPWRVSQTDAISCWSLGLAYIRGGLVETLAAATFPCLEQATVAFPQARRFAAGRTLQGGGFQLSGAGSMRSV
eukprot:Skav225041  [mRNA]  locus=scaffold2061:324367:324687:+ [translate_table: standard]